MRALTETGKHRDGRSVYSLSSLHEQERTREVGWSVFPSSSEERKKQADFVVCHREGADARGQENRSEVYPRGGIERGVTVTSTWDSG